MCRRDRICALLLCQFLRILHKQIEHSVEIQANYKRFGRLILVHGELVPCRNWCLVEPAVLHQNFVASLNVGSFSTSREIGLLMLNAIVIAIRYIILVFSGQKRVALENVALRQQLAVFRRDVRRPQLRGRDRFFWVALRMIWKSKHFRMIPHRGTCSGSRRMYNTPGY